MRINFEKKLSKRDYSGVLSFYESGLFELVQKAVLEVMVSADCEMACEYWFEVNKDEVITYESEGKTVIKTGAEIRELYESEDYANSVISFLEMVRDAMANGTRFDIREYVTMKIAE